MATLTAGQAIVRVLKAEGVKCVFGLPGGHTLHIYDELYDTPEIRNILVRHENAAASMAAAYAQLTGEAGVCLVTAGPGATNIVSGIAEAFVGALPIVVIAGRAPTDLAHRGANQEISTDRLFAPIAKWTIRIDRADLIVDLLRRAFAIARSGKPGPVVLDIPIDLLGRQVSFENYVPTGKPPRYTGDPGQIAAAVEQLQRAKRPIIIAGGGTVASGAFSEMLELAERLALPVLTTLAGRGSISDDHPLSVGGQGAHCNALSKKLLNEADFVLGLGCRFEQMETNWQPESIPRADACYVQVDIDPKEIGYSIIPKIGIVGDIKAVLGAILEAVRDANPRPEVSILGALPKIRELTRAAAEVEREAASMESSLQRPIHPIRVIRTARKVFPRETTVAFDIGCLAQHMAGAFPFFKVYEPRSCIAPSSFYGMGFTAAALPAARVVYPDRPALGFVGDGSFQMVTNVLPVATDHRLPVTWCVLDDQALGSIRDIQEYFFNDRIFSTEFQFQPDFVKIAEGCGCYGEKVTDPLEVEAAFGRALAANLRGAAAVLDFIVARERSTATRDYFGLHKRREEPG